MMRTLLSPLENPNVHNYMDDILIATRTFNDNLAQSQFLVIKRHWINSMAVKMSHRIGEIGVPVHIVVLETH